MAELEWIADDDIFALEDMTALEDKIALEEMLDDADIVAYKADDEINALLEFIAYRADDAKIELAEYVAYATEDDGSASPTGPCGPGEEIDTVLTSCVTLTVFIVLLIDILSVIQ